MRGRPAWASSGSTSLTRVYETFLAKLTDRVSRLHPGSDEKTDYGPMTMPGQIDVISRHLADAVARGGRTQPGRAEDAVDTPYVRPVILTDVPGARWG